MSSNLLGVVCFCVGITHIWGHGMMLEPPNRSSLWRFYNDSPVNYDDNQNFCGGRHLNRINDVTADVEKPRPEFFLNITNEPFVQSSSDFADAQLLTFEVKVQWDLFDGKCGVCGDRYDDPHPQENENGGLFGRYKVVRYYEVGSEIDVSIALTVNHLGNFQYSLCVLELPHAPESGEDCFQPLTLGDGSPKYNVSPGDFWVNHTVKLPENLTCNRCVLRWHYTAGNSWGDCGNGTAADGCGPQETFRSCSDIMIIKARP